ncbi:MAG: hypothetical protein LBU23_06025 [Planctomycetota bacterium]|nr:hypothetical protein [Planctomycetota bacterium]
MPDIAPDSGHPHEAAGGHGFVANVISKIAMSAGQVEAVKQPTGHSNAARRRLFIM